MASRAFTAIDIESPVADEVKSIIRKVLEDDSLEYGYSFGAFMTTLFPHEFTWKEFECWHNCFTEVGYFPHMWSGLEHKPPGLSAESKQYLSDLATLPETARLFLWECGFLTATGPRTLTMYDLKRRVKMSAAEADRWIKQLAGTWVTYPVPLSGRVQVLKVDQLKKLLRDYGAAVSGRKADLIARVLDTVPDEEVLKALPHEAQQDMVANARWLPSSDLNALKYREKIISLLDHSVHSLARAQRYIQDPSCKKVGVMGSDQCPVCRGKADAEVEAVTGLEHRLPPFHPGCRCNMQPHFEFDINVDMPEPAKPTKASTGCGSVLAVIALSIVIALLFFF